MTANELLEAQTIQAGALPLIKTKPAEAALFLRQALLSAVIYHYKTAGFKLPKEKTLPNLTGTKTFKDTVGELLSTELDYIRILAVGAEIDPERISEEQAQLSSTNLTRYLDFVTKGTKPKNISEFATRKIYIDTDLQNLGWQKKKDWIEEFPLEGMPNKEGKGYADYVLFDNDKPLAVIEAKKTSQKIETGRHQAELYAELLQKKYNLPAPPVIFLSNGYETRIIDKVNKHPERRISGIYSKRDLQKLYHKARTKQPLLSTPIDKNIIDRYYQIQAVKAVAQTYTELKRKALLVMATGSGKTRVAAAVIDNHIKANQATKILFLADRTNLVEQAWEKFDLLFHDKLPIADYCKNKDNPDATIVISTYQTMMNSIDYASDKNGRVFTPGHFDLIIVDEAHRSIYNKYRDIFTYFDAPLLGLTATPKDDIDKNTYRIFDLEKGKTTFNYDLEQGVKDGFLIPFTAKEIKLKFLDEGITYGDLDDDEQEDYEDDFTDEEGNIPDSISPSALNSYVFNKDTIRKVINTLMNEGLKTDYGSRLGKTIIFAKNHKHAEVIYEIFREEYPKLAGEDFCKVIDNHINYAHDLERQFKNPASPIRIAISVDMLDTGVDIEEILNLVFFKKVKSKAKFWQMIGRGTRTCKGLIDGNDKTVFKIFDFCQNFTDHKLSPNGDDSPRQKTVQEQLYILKSLLIIKIKKLSYVPKPLLEYKEELIKDLVSQVKNLNRMNFGVRQHLEMVEYYAKPDAYHMLTETRLRAAAEELAPLLEPTESDAAALRFDVLLYSMELSSIDGQPQKKYLKDLISKLRLLETVRTIPEVVQKHPDIRKYLKQDYLTSADIADFEEIRLNIRSIIKYLPKTGHDYTTDFTDEITGTTTHSFTDAVGEGFGYADERYVARAEQFLRMHQDNPVIQKLWTNIPLNEKDIVELQKILWKEIGTEDEYRKEVGNKDLGIFVREIVGLDRNTALETFAKYINEASLNSQQIYFIRRVIDHVEVNGLVEDFRIFTRTPFTDHGKINELFNSVEWNAIEAVITLFEKNATVN